MQELQTQQNNTATETATNARLFLKRCLMQHNHRSPCEMVAECLEVEPTLDKARQLLGHGSFSCQEHAQGYLILPVRLQFNEARLQDIINTV